MVRLILLRKAGVGYIDIKPTKTKNIAGDKEYLFIIIKGLIV